jgi:hypothetical protein
MANTRTGMLFEFVVLAFLSLSRSSLAHHRLSSCDQSLLDLWFLVRAVDVTGDRQTHRNIEDVCFSTVHAYSRVYSVHNRIL